MTLRIPWAAAGAGLLLAGLIAGGCGSSEGNPPPAEPTASPPLKQRPAGDVLKIGSEAEGIAVDSADGIAAVAFRDPNRLELIDVDRAKVLGEVKTPESSRHLEMAQDGTTVLVPVEYVDKLLQVDLSAYAPEPAADAGSKSSRTSLPDSIEVGDFPHDAVEAADGTIFVGDEGADTISVVRDGRVTATLDAPEQPGGVATSGDVLAVVSVAAREISFYDTETLEQLAVLDAGAGPSHVVAGGDGRFYVTDTGGDAILVYDATPEGGGEPRLLDRTNVDGSPYGIAVDPNGERLFVTRTAANRVVELAITDLNPKIVDSFPTVRQPNSVGVDGRSGKVVVAGRVNGDVQIFDPDAKPGDGK